VIKPDVLSYFYLAWNLLPIEISQYRKLIARAIRSRRILVLKMRPMKEIGKSLIYITDDTDRGGGIERNHQLMQQWR